MIDIINTNFNKYNIIQVYLYLDKEDSIFNHNINKKNKQ